MSELDFVRATLADEMGRWDTGALSRASTLSVPDAVLGVGRGLAKADIYSEWSVWFVESLANPARYASGRFKYAQLFSDVLESVRSAFPSFTEPDAKELASEVSRIIQRRLKTYEMRRRRSFSRDEKLTLLGLSGDPPRCWITGMEFSDEAIDIFLNGSSVKIPQPLYVDVLRPIGLKDQDFMIQVDHVSPFSTGGDEGENLKLATGWANRHKSAYMSLYEVAGAPLVPRYTHMEKHFSLPRPFWSVRVLATSRRCEHKGGCEKTVGTAELTVAPRRIEGMLNPLNLMACCPDHDPLDSSTRMLPKAVVERIWGSTKLK